MKYMLAVWLVSLSLAAAVSGSDENETVLEKDDAARFLPVKVDTGRKRKTTDDILKHIGMSKMRGPWNYHKKRLASQGRKTRTGDSHMYVIKLPPNPYYYEGDVRKAAAAAAAPGRNVNRIPISFKTNGKPGKIYHYNLPIVKKMAARKTGGKSTPDHGTGALWLSDQPKPKRVSYYKPKKPSKQAFQKYFPGNGRPHALYVIERNRKTSKRKGTAGKE